MSAESRESQIRFSLWILSNSAGHEQFCDWVRRKLCSHWQHKSNLCCMFNSNLIIYTPNSRKTHRIWFYRACRAILYWFLKHASPADFISSFRLDHLMSHFRLGTMYFCLCQLWPWYPFDPDTYFDPDTRFFDESKEYNLFFVKK